MTFCSFIVGALGTERVAMQIQTDLAMKHGEEGTLHVEGEELLRLVQVGRRRPVQRLRGGPLEPRARGQGLRRVTRRTNVTLQDLKSNGLFSKIFSEEYEEVVLYLGISVQLVVVHPGGEEGGSLDGRARVILEDGGHVARRGELHDGVHHPPAVLFARERDTFKYCKSFEVLCDA